MHRLDDRLRYDRLAPRRLIALDRSLALLRAVRDRTASTGQEVTAVCADFHNLPLPGASIDMVAAFCLYHSRRPEHVVAELARVLAPGGNAVLVTKSADSYRAGGDPHRSCCVLGAMTPKTQQDRPFHPRGLCGPYQDHGADCRTFMIARSGGFRVQAHEIRRVRRSPG